MGGLFSPAAAGENNQSIVKIKKQPLRGAGEVLDY